MKEQFKDFSKLSKKILKTSLKLAKKDGEVQAGTEYILFAILQNEANAAAQLIAEKGITNSELKMMHDSSEMCCRAKRHIAVCMSAESTSILKAALAGARQAGIRLATPEHILCAILENNACRAHRMLSCLTDTTTLCRECRKISGQTIYNSSFQNRPIINGYRSNKYSEKIGKDLTRLALDGKLDPVLCRDDEIERMITILCRRQKNNPCLVGEPGVGKTALVEALAQLIAAGRVPKLLQGKRILSLDITGMVAGTKYRGDFEEKFKNLLDELVKEKNTIVFMDEIHMIAGAGAAEGAVDAAGILKPYLARGEIRMIGATTYQEYRKLIRKEPALERRFGVVNVEEPSACQAENMLTGVSLQYEKYHQIKISKEAIQQAVKISTQYMPGRFLPDKALDLIDEAAAYKQIQLKQAALDADDFLQAGDIDQAAAKICGIPLEKITEVEKNKLSAMENELKQYIQGQDEAIKTVVNAIKRGRLGMCDSKRPVAAMLFLGPTGVGKTYLAKVLSQIWFNTQKSLLRFDMSEYMEPHSGAKLIGAPPGYSGYEDGGALTNKVRENPYSIILFDEFEKAHPNIQNLLLQVFEDGFLTDSLGRKIDFTNCFIIMTSNLGAELLYGEKSVVGFCGINKEALKKSKAIEKAKEYFKPEFLGRLDEIVVFNSLNQTDLKNIADKILAELENRAYHAGYCLKHSNELARFFAEREDGSYGARQIRKAIEQTVGQALADEITKGNITQGSTLCACVSEGTIVLKQEKICTEKYWQKDKIVSAV